MHDLGCEAIRSVRPERGPEILLEDRVIGQQRGVLEEADPEIRTAC